MLRRTVSFIAGLMVIGLVGIQSPSLAQNPNGRMFINGSESTANIYIDAYQLNGNQVGDVQLNAPGLSLWGGWAYWGNLTFRTDFGIYPTAVLHCWAFDANWNLYGMDYFSRQVPNSNLGAISVTVYPWGQPNNVIYQTPYWWVNGVVSIFQF